MSRWDEVLDSDESDADAARRQIAAEAMTDSIHPCPEGRLRAVGVKGSGGCGIAVQVVDGGGTSTARHIIMHPDKARAFALALIEMANVAEGRT